ncbi:FAD-binding oxidoreductase [Thetidibacter halocola]|uniref:FAD-binding oxidoreductase n=1 Tax=Thetidibacter halocola TaxID=2827239 RepID=A0A8J8BAQ1_9RHOB|nr:FAD-binding oxidoreductase [Thetidibacter halocola]MBS0125448.1 FAD-binding oxidoreductase [Thetidibacter halocola]
MILDDLTAALGADCVTTGADMAPWCRDWTGQHAWTPLCVIRPRDTAGVSDALRLCNAARVPVVPVSGNTGLAGGTLGEGAVMLSLDRMNRIREIRSDARLAVVEAGVILSTLHTAAEQHGLAFPMTFGARGSCMIGGMLATNAGGSNVLRYGNTRDLVLGIEAVLADGRVVNLMSALHKDNSGLNLKHLLIGSEGILGVITAAVLKLVPRPRAFATAMVAAPGLPQALRLLNRLQEATGGAVEAFEYMDRVFMDRYAEMHPEAQEPFDTRFDVNLLVEVGATAPRDVESDADGVIPVAAYLEGVLADLLEEGAVLDATVAQSEAQRRAFWARREAAAEITMSRKPIVLCDIAVATDRVAVFLEAMQGRLAGLDAGAVAINVSHLGDGNVHYSAWPSRDDAGLKDAITEAVEDEVLRLGGSFSAEHGVGVAKLNSMRRRKDPVALAAMRAIKAALDPNGILNPGKVLPG